MNGKSRCKILKEIRRQIAEQNDIEFVTSECKYQGDCAGTCPKCESEVRYLEKELEKRKMLGKTVLVCGLALAVTSSASGCMNEIKDDPQTDTEKNGDSYSDTMGWIQPPEEEYDGEMVVEGPSFALLLNLPQDQRNKYISVFSMNEIRYSWNSDEAVISPSRDVFYIVEQGVKYRVQITYDESGGAVSVTVDIYTESELMGDLLP